VAVTEYWYEVVLIVHGNDGSSDGMTKGFQLCSETNSSRLYFVIGAFKCSNSG
jgi:hypothetical protein